MARKDIILFTGQSGIGIIKSLKKIEQCNKKVISIEREMEKYTKKSFKNVILSSPPHIIEKYWSETFKYMQKKKKLSERGKDEYIFLTFHATYFQTKKTEFISPIDLNMLKDIADRIKVIIVLIDDCYNIYQRLMNKDEMYDYERYLKDLEPFDALVTSIINLFLILSWRETEIAFSHQISHCFDNIPLYLIAVKHPIIIFERLINTPLDQLNFVYLSHSISDIRVSDSLRNGVFYGELNELIREIIKKEDMILFIPDTIDEKRIKTEKMDDYSYFLPDREKRWPLPFAGNKILFSPISTHLGNINPINPNSYKVPHDIRIMKTISTLLELLDKKISSQINSRDLSLVELSKSIFVYRPYYCYTVPTGVEEELRYLYKLRTEYLEKDRKIYMFTTDEDYGRLCINTLFRELEFIKLEESISNELGDLKLKWYENDERISEFSEKRLDKVKIRGYVEDIIGEGYKFSESYTKPSKRGTLKSHEALQPREELQKSWDKAFSIIPEEEPLKQYLTVEDVYKTFHEKDLPVKIEEFQFP